MKLNAVLLNPVQARPIIDRLWEESKGWLTGNGARLRLRVEIDRRSLDCNARFHAMLADVARQAQYMGKRRSIDFWKGLFVSGWQIATKQNPEIVPGLEGEFINIRESTASMSGRKLSEVMTYMEAWAAENGVVFTAPEDWQ